MRCKMKKSIIALVVLLACGALLAADSTDWPSWRGPGQNGSTTVGKYPTEWNANSNLLWKIELPGKGCSTPIVWDRRVYLTAPIAGHNGVLALDWSGKLLWQVALGIERKGQSNNGSGCNPSPTTDGKSVFVYFKSGELAAFSLDGTVLWRTNLQQQYGKNTLYWDIGTSPVLTQKDVVVAVMHHGNSYLIAFDKLSGNAHWRVSRDYPTPDEGDHSYTTPIVYQEHGAQALLVWGGEHLTAHDASDGKIIWSCGGFNPEAKTNWVAIASPVIAGDIAIVPYGRGSRLHGIKLGGSGDVTTTNRIWERKDTGSFVPTPAEYKGRVYLLHDRGEVECIDPASGKTIWSGKFPKSSASYYSSPTVANGLLYATREDGAVLVGRVDDHFEFVSQNDMGERLIASPVPVSDRLLIRGESHLSCLGTNSVWPSEKND